MDGFLNEKNNDIDIGKKLKGQDLLSFILINNSYSGLNFNVKDIFFILDKFIFSNQKFNSYVFLRGIFNMVDENQNDLDIVSFIKSEFFKNINKFNLTEKNKCVYDLSTFILFNNVNNKVIFNKQEILFILDKYFVQKNNEKDVEILNAIIGCNFGKNGFNRKDIIFLIKNTI